MKRIIFPLILCLLSSACNQELRSSELPAVDERSGIIGGTVGPDDVENSTAKVASAGICSGVLISPDLVLTAAHCIPESGSKNAVTLFNIDTSTKKTDIMINGVGVAHSKFTMEWDAKGYASASNDVGLIKLNEKAHPSLKPVVISEDSVKKGDMLVLAGFGIADLKTGDLSARAQSVAVPVASLEGQKLIMDQSAGRGAFLADSGGPAFLRTPRGLVLMGTVSGPIMHKSAKEFLVTYPVRFMKTSEFKDFILTQAKALKAIPPTFIKTETPKTK